MHGTSDDVVPIKQSNELVEALTKAGVPVEFRPIKRGGHVLVTNENNDYVVAFLKKTLKAQEQNTDAVPERK
jgi:dipeptidyl aminopeptidase/acylaminoacyl peptidase